MSLDARGLARKALYRSGALGAFHRVRNGNALTVLMFHRVLSPRDPRWRTADPDWTLSDSLFRGTLAFLAEHYHVVPLGDVVAAWREARPLPPNPALITFDDGWRDNLEYALPLLREAGLPAVVFVVAGAVGAREPAWEEAVTRAFRTGRLSGPVGAELHAAAAARSAPPARGAPPAAGTTPPVARSAEDLQRLLTGLRGLDDAAREALLHRPSLRLFDEENMLGAADLAALLAGGVQIGSHGLTHTALTDCPRPDVELRRSRERLQELLGPAAAPGALCFAFPHGRYTPGLAGQALEAGYALVFTSDEHLNTVPAEPSLGRVLGRIHVPAQQISSDGLHAAPERLALWLFDRPEG